MTVQIRDSEFANPGPCCDSSYLIDWPKLPHCSWVKLPDKTYVLLRGTASDLIRAALVYPVPNQGWGASYEGWEPWNWDVSPSTVLRQRFPSAETAANALIQAVEEGYLGECWNKRDTDWCVCDYYQFEPGKYFRWRGGDTFEVVLREDDTWLILRNGKPVWKPSTFDGVQGELMLFKNADTAKRYLENH